MNDQEYLAMTAEQRAAYIKRLKDLEKQKPTPDFDLALSNLHKEFAKLDNDQKKNLFKRHKDTLAALGLKAGKTGGLRIDSIIKNAIAEKGEAGMSADEIKALAPLAGKGAAVDKALNGGRCQKKGQPKKTNHWWTMKGKLFIPCA